MQQLMSISFNFALDFSGIVWSLTNVVQGGIGIITGFISGLAVLVHRKGSYKVTYHKSMSALYGAIIPSVGGTIGLLTVNLFSHDRSIRQMLDGLALFPLVVGIIGMIVFIIARNKMILKKNK